MPPPKNKVSKISKKEDQELGEKQKHEDDEIVDYEGEPGYTDAGIREAQDLGLTSPSQIPLPPSKPATPRITSPTDIELGGSPISPNTLEEDREIFGVDENCSPPLRPSTPTQPLTDTASSPLSPVDGRRAWQGQCKGNPYVSPPSPPKPRSPSPATSPTGAKTAHQSNPAHYTKLRSKLRRDRNVELMERGVMGKTKLEDRRIRERMVSQLHKNMKIPDDVRKVIRNLVRHIPKLEDESWCQRLGRFSFVDIMEMWKFQYLKAEEFIEMKGWSNSRFDDPAAIRYIISTCRHKIGMPMGGPPG